MISNKISESMKSASWIRAMFEEGEKLRKIYGPDKVFDFSLGNPDYEPPLEVRQSLKKYILEDVPNVHKYMSNAGYADVRKTVAGHITGETGVQLTESNIVMTCGAAGGLNVVLKTILNPGEEVIVFSPFFVEYLSYIDNHGGKGVVIPTNPSTFEPDPAVLEKSIKPQTKAIILNSPNNPSGVIYSEKVLKELAQVLAAKEKELGTTIYVLSDEPYSKLVYDGVKVPSMLRIFKNAIVINSFSKSLALPGERIGYIAASSNIDGIDLLVNGLIYCNRILGYVNAPSLFQKVIADSLNAEVDTSEYKARRDILYNHLVKLGFDCIKPEGAFYLFPKALIDDDVEFTKRAVKYNLLLVPGKGFGCPGYFRIAYCVSRNIIENSLPAFEALVKEFR